ncbi:MAG: CotH kinase family protein [Bacteroidota bacterium]
MLDSHSIWRMNGSLMRGIMLFLSLGIFCETFAQTSATVIISEVMAANEQTLEDQEGDTPDWIELYNSGSESVQLAGWYLSDEETTVTKWALPPIILAPETYLLVFASGKDRTDIGLHTNFKLTRSGESLILTQTEEGRIMQSEIIAFPAQSTDVSYALIQGQWGLSDVPTPGSPNVYGSQLNPPLFSVERGLQDSAFELMLISPRPGTMIRYTLNGSDPGGVEGEFYQAPIPISTTSIVRALTVKENHQPSKTITHSYLFPASVSSQPNDPIGYPDHWGKFSTIEGLAPADYEMDPEITQSDLYRDQLIPALRSLPSMSLVTKKEHLFSQSADPDSGGIYIHTGPPTGGFGLGWERPVSMELIDPKTATSIQLNCGIRIHGGHSRLPEKSPKHSFKLLFREEYGPKKLKYDLFGGDATQEFNSLVLRAGFNQSWVHWSGNQRSMAQYINDTWVKDTWRKMGHLAAHSKFVHLYVNGLYWGIYDVTERMDDDFMESYLSGEEEDFDVIKDYAEVVDGEGEAWSEMLRLAEEPDQFFLIQGKDETGQVDPDLQAYLDMQNLMDYMILNFYIGNQDWDHHNWAAVRNRLHPTAGFQFLPWDSERSFIGLNDRVVEEHNEGRPSYLYTQFRNNLYFRRQFAERVRALLKPGGLLSPDSVARGWRIRSEEIRLALIAESARWGDYRRDVHPYRQGDYELYRPDVHWEQEQERLFSSYFPQRSEIVFRQLKEIGLADDPLDRLTGTGSFPNPFSESVSIYVRLNRQAPVLIHIYDLSGKRVESLDLGTKSAGIHKVEWTPGHHPPGLFIYHLFIGADHHVGKMMYQPE